MSQRAWILTAVTLGSGIVFLDSTIVNVALPRIGQELPAVFMGVLEGQAYINSGYLAVLSALLILAGSLADIYGRRRIFAIGLALFGITSVLCGLAPTLELLVVFRLAQGAAGALLIPGSLSIITATFEGRDRGWAFGVWAAATSALTTLGPLVGGALVDILSWRVAFLINAPLVLLALYALRHMPESRDEAGARRLDWLGSIVVALAVGGISFGLIRGQEREWQDPVAFLALGVGVVSAVLFPILMLRRRDPLVPPSLFRSREFTVINISTFLIYGALYVTSTFWGLYLQGTIGYTPVAAGAIGLPIGILLSTLSTRVGSLAGRIGPRPFLVVGPLLMAGGVAWQLRIPSSSDPWVLRAGDLASWIPPTDVLVDVLPTVVLFAIGISLVVAPLTTALMGSVPVSNAGVGSAINNAVSRVGQPLVTALLFIAISTSFYGALTTSLPDRDLSSRDVRRELPPLNPPRLDLTEEEAQAVREASTGAYHLAMLVCALLLLGGAAVNRAGIRPGAPPEDARDPSEAGAAPVG